MLLAHIIDNTYKGACALGWKLLLCLFFVFGCGIRMCSPVMNYVKQRWPPFLFLQCDPYSNCSLYSNVKEKERRL